MESASGAYCLRVRLEASLKHFLETGLGTYRVGGQYALYHCCDVQLYCWFWQGMWQAWSDLWLYLPRTWEHRTPTGVQVTVHAEQPPSLCHFSRLTAGSLLGICTSQPSASSTVVVAAVVWALQGWVVMVVPDAYNAGYTC